MFKARDAENGIVLKRRRALLAMTRGDARILRIYAVFKHRARGFGGACGGSGAAGAAAKPRTRIVAAIRARAEKI